MAWLFGGGGGVKEAKNPVKKTIGRKKGSKKTMTVKTNKGGGVVLKTAREGGMMFGAWRVDATSCQKEGKEKGQLEGARAISRGKGGVGGGAVRRGGIGGRVKEEKRNSKKQKELGGIKNTAVRF